MAGVGGMRRRGKIAVCSAGVPVNVVTLANSVEPLLKEEKKPDGDCASL